MQGGEIWAICYGRVGLDEHGATSASGVNRTHAMSQRESRTTVEGKIWLGCDAVSWPDDHMAVGSALRLKGRRVSGQSRCRGTIRVSGRCVCL